MQVQAFPIVKIRACAYIHMKQINHYYVNTNYCRLMELPIPFKDIMKIDTFHKLTAFSQDI
jgi:hypothetical protein